jgi:glycosyltransferase involved in cell wall biosynthesis
MSRQLGGEIATRTTEPSSSRFQPQPRQPFSRDCGLGTTGSTSGREPSTMLVHDYLLVMRGAERTFAAICDLWPNAPVATLLYDSEVFGGRLSGHDVRTSPLQHLGAKQSTFKALLPLMPWATEHLDVSGHDLVISSSSAFAHGVRVDPGAAHVCYCYTPFRYAWYEHEAGVSQVPRLARPLVANALYRIREWDRRAAARATRYIAISRVSQERLMRYWNVEAPIVHPPVGLARFAPGEPEDFFLVVCELVRHKRVELALEAARRAGVRVKVVGGGSDEQRLRSLYGEHADFLGRIDDDALADLYPRARALIVPNVEEFGIAAVEAQAAGRPVVAAASGGALETVIDGETGVLVPPGDLDALTAVLRDDGLDRLDPAAAVANARQFSIEAFKSKMRTHVASALQARRAEGPATQSGASTRRSGRARPKLAASTFAPLVRTAGVVTRHRGI